MEPQVYEFGEIHYYRVKDFSAPPYNMKYKSPSRFMVDNDISEKAFIRARYNIDGDNLWTETTGTTKKDELFVRKSMCKKFMEELTEGLVPLPNEIDIKKEEQFVASDGSYLTIKTVGKRRYNKCYFKCKDVQKQLGFVSLTTDIVKARSPYEEGLDYVFFVEDNIKQLYLTYYGILRLFFSSRKKELSKYLDWVCETVFTAQMGTSTAKLKAAAELAAIDPETVKKIFGKTCYDLPYVYLFKLGTAKDLRKSMKLDDDIPDNFIIYKWGRTNCMKRRLCEHINEYRQYKGVKLELVTFGFVDSENQVDAEKEIAAFFIANEKWVKFKKYKELGALGPRGKTLAKQHFETVVTSKRGTLIGLANELRNFMKENVRLEKELAESKAREAKLETKVEKLEAKLDEQQKDSKTEITKREAKLEEQLKESKAREAKLETKLAKTEDKLEKLEEKYENSRDAKPAKKPSSKTKK
jgi:hypothetical protein